MAFNLKNRSFLTLRDYSPKEIAFLLKLAADLKAAKYAGTERPVLQGKDIALIFEKSSTRTRVGFEVAAENGEVIGEVDNVVLVDGSEMAVVGIGGFLGLGEHDVALPLTDLTADAADDTKLKASGYTKAQLEAMAEFDPEAADEVSADAPVMLGKS